MDKWLSHPTALKIISLAIGILMWAIVHFDSERSPDSVAALTETKEIDAVQVLAVGLDENNYALRSLEPSSVRLTVRASKAVLMQMTPDDFQVTVDVSTSSEGSRVLPVSVSKPIGVEITDVQPRNVTVHLERMVTKEFEMQVKTEGKPDHNYKLGTPIVKPNNRVHVTLPEDLMEKVGFVGGTISVDGEEETVNDKKVKVTVLDKDGKEMTGAIVNPSVVEVEVPITKPFKNLPLQIGFTGKLPEGLAIASFKPSVEQVTVYGPQEVLDKYDFYDGITVNLSKLTQSGSLVLNVPTENGIATVDPATVTVSYTIVPVQTKLLTGLRATIIGLSDGLIAKTTLPESGLIDLTVSGAPGVLLGIGAKDVQLIADLSGLGPGSHIVPIDVHLPTFVGQAAPNPLNITVEITDNTATPTPNDGQTPGTGDDGAAVGDGTEGGQNGAAGDGTDGGQNGAGGGDGTEDGQNGSDGGGGTEGGQNGAGNVGADDGASADANGSGGSADAGGSGSGDDGTGDGRTSDGRTGDGGSSSGNSAANYGGDLSGKGGAANNGGSSGSGGGESAADEAGGVSAADGGSGGAGDGRGSGSVEPPLADGGSAGGGSEDGAADGGSAAEGGAGAAN